MKVVTGTAQLKTTEDLDYDETTAESAALRDSMELMEQMTTDFEAIAREKYYSVNFDIAINIFNSILLSTVHVSIFIPLKK